MATKSILLAVTDAQMLNDITGVLGPGWDSTSAASDSDVLDQLEKRTFDALLVDFNLGSPDASDLINLAVEKHPDTITFLLAHEADLALVAAKVSGSPEILPKPLELASLKSRVENGGNGPEPVTSQASTPAPPSVVPAIYAEVLKALEDAGVTTEQVGELIACDRELSAEVLMLTSSSYKGLPGNLTEPTEAVELLGLQTVKALVMALRFLAEHRHLKPSYLSFDQVWQHSKAVAQIARDLVLFETKDRVLASQAFAAGLVHDLGKVVLVTNFDDLYGRVHSLARKQPVPFWEIEKEMFGADHGEIGACLIGMWNLPGPIVDAAALHHDPSGGDQEQMTPLAAVHVANVLAHEIGAGDEFRVAPIINTTFLNALGLLQRLPIWRARFANRSRGNQQPADSGTHASGWATVASETASRTTNHAQEHSAQTRTATSQHDDDSMNTRSSSRFARRNWVYAGVGAACLLALWLGTQQPETTQSVPVLARATSFAQTPAPGLVVSAPAMDPTPETARPVSAIENSSAHETVTEPAADPETETPGFGEETAVSEYVPPVIPAPANSNISKSPPSQPIAAPVTEPAKSTLASLPPKQNPAEFKVNGIIYTAARPCAILNGQTVFVGDFINGARVLGISQTEVTLQINGMHRSFGLH
ncbi:MAG TPA: HDOD domain-containing protein [Candidatus Dormibacteraeota bacterium]|nr:HDOD domain-containing protein [Candidatus Dormibacteraeota bacterium]